MKVKCISQLASTIPREQLGYGENGTARYEELELGKTYFVYGILQGEKKSKVLINVNGHQDWLPLALFDVVDTGVPDDWQHLKVTGHSEFGFLVDFGFTDLIGYEKLVHSYQHYAGLIEREPEEMMIFFKEQDKYESRETRIF